MNKFKNNSRVLTWFVAFLLSALAAGCGGGGGGGQDPILGTGGIAVLAPTVTAVAPLANATGVPINTKIITAAFSKAMDPATLTTATFTLACPAGTPVAGAVTYLAAGSVATLTLPAAPNLPPSTVCTATVTTGAKDTTGIPLASNFVWTFTTGVTPDATRPRVTLTVPATTVPGPTAGALPNAAITAVFTEDMAPATIIAAGTFTVTGPGATPVAGVVTYAVGSRTATFTPTVALAFSTTFTATITTAATDIATNALAGNQAPLPAASNYLWTFTTTAAPVPPASVSVLSTNPAAGAAGVCANTSINATFTVPSGLRMDPLTVIAGTTFTVTGPAPGVAAVAGVVALDVPTGRIATFTPLAALAVGTYTATIKGGATGVKDLAIPANTMVSDFVWSFTVVPATGACPAPLVLGSASPFGALACTALTGSTFPPTGTTVNGDIGTAAVMTSITNFVGGGVPATPSIVNGTIFANVPNLGAPGTPIADANTARLAGATAGALGTLVPTSNLGAETGFGNGVAGNFFAGAYRSGSSIAISTPITLNAQGNANAVWIFFMPVSTLTTTGTGNVLLANGAQAKNVFWVVGSSATIGTPLFNGNILAATAITMDTVDTTVNGRLLTSGPSCAAITFDAHLHTVNVPAP